MNPAEGQEVWEANSDQPPPQSVEIMIEQGERLLWAGLVPCQALRGYFTSLAGLFVIVTAVLVTTAPWGQSLAEYCGPSPERACRRYHFLAWPLLAAMTYLSAGVSYQLWRMQTAPWTFTYAISDRKAYVLDGRKPHGLQTVDLARHKARLNALGHVNFGRGKEWLPGLGGLDRSAAKRAVYWANEGRLRPEFQSKDAL